MKNFVVRVKLTIEKSDFLSVEENQAKIAMGSLNRFRQSMYAKSLQTLYGKFQFVNRIRL